MSFPRSFHAWGVEPTLGYEPRTCCSRMSRAVGRDPQFRRRGPPRRTAAPRYASAPRRGPPSKPHIGTVALMPANRRRGQIRGRAGHRHDQRLATELGPHHRAGLAEERRPPRTRGTSTSGQQSLSSSATPPIGATSCLTEVRRRPRWQNFATTSQGPSVTSSRGCCLAYLSRSPRSARSSRAR